MNWGQCRLAADCDRMDQLAKQVAEMALRLGALSGESRKDPKVLDAVEQLAKAVLKEVSAAKVGDSYAVGEISGRWRAVNWPH
jgi:hypothetical protein